MDRVVIYRSSRPRMSGGGWRWKYLDGTTGKRLATSSEGSEDLLTIGGGLHRVLGLTPSGDPEHITLDGGNEAIWTRGLGDTRTYVNVVVEP